MVKLLFRFRVIVLVVLVCSGTFVIVMFFWFDWVSVLGGGVISWVSDWCWVWLFVV